MFRHLLVPIDGTRLASMTIERALAYARDAGARITFFHARRDFAATGEGSLLHSMSPAAFAVAAAGQSEALLARAAAAAAAAGVVCERRSVISDRPHEAIVEAAAAAGCDLVFMASHGRRGLRARMAGSVTHRVIDAAPLPVLVARVESNAAPDAQERALSAIRDEHRSLAAVLRAMQQHVRERAGTGQALDARLMGAAIFFIEAFPEKLHHPKEELTLFARLRQRAPQCGPVLDGLEQQHRNGSQQFAALRQALREGPAAFDGALAVFANSQWQHLATEEDVLLPMASEHLQPGDWPEIADAFEGHGDPRFDADAEDSFAQVFVRLMNLASPSRGAGL